MLSAARRGSPHGWDSPPSSSLRLASWPGVGAWAGAASQHSGLRFGSLVTAALNVVPPGLLLLGLGALVLGAWPRRTSTVVYGYLAWSFLVEFAGRVVYTSHLPRPPGCGPGSRGTASRPGRRGHAASDRRSPRLRAGPCPVAERLGRDALHLPSSVALTEEQQDRVLAAVCAVVRRSART